LGIIVKFRCHFDARLWLTVTMREWIHIAPKSGNIGYIVVRQAFKWQQTGNKAATNWQQTGNIRYIVAQQALMWQEAGGQTSRVSGQRSAGLIFLV
jgi:hypothetical protein